MCTTLQTQRAENRKSGIGRPQSSGQKDERQSEKIQIKKKKKRREKEVFRLTLESTMRMLVFQAEHSTYTHIHTYTDNAIKTATTKKN